MAVTTSSKVTQQPKYARPGAVEATHGIRRTALYAWDKAGVIHLIRVKQPGAKRGTTLVDLAELESVIEKFRNQGARGVA